MAVQKLTFAQLPFKVKMLIFLVVSLGVLRIVSGIVLQIQHERNCRILAEMYSQLYRNGVVQNSSSTNADSMYRECIEH